MPILSSRGSVVVTVGLLSLTLLGAGCGNARPMIDTETNTVTLSGGNGNGLSAGENAKIPDTFPPFFPRYPNAKTSLVFSENNGKSNSLVQETNDSYTQAQTQVEAHFQSQGFTKKDTFPAENLVILSFEKGTIHCQVNIAQQDALTQIQTTCIEK